MWVKPLGRSQFLAWAERCMAPFGLSGNPLPLMQHPWLFPFSGGTKAAALGWGVCSSPHPYSHARTARACRGGQGRRAGAALTVLLKTLLSPTSGLVGRSRLCCYLSEEQAGGHWRPVWPPLVSCSFLEQEEWLEWNQLPVGLRRRWREARQGRGRALHGSLQAWPPWGDAAAS